MRSFNGKAILDRSVEQISANLGPNLRFVLEAIVSIEFSPLVEIGVNNGHILPHETTSRTLLLGYIQIRML